MLCPSPVMLLNVTFFKFDFNIFNAYSINTVILGINQFFLRIIRNQSARSLLHSHPKLFFIMPNNRPISLNIHEGILVNPHTNINQLAF